MAKKKRSRQDKKNGAVASNKVPNTKRTDPCWNELEQSFFASAPPDIPAAAAQPERFDDLDADLAVPARRPSRAELRDGLATIRRLAVDFASASWLNRRNITIAIASVMLLIGLSAVVFASR